MYATTTPVIRPKDSNEHEWFTNVDTIFGGQEEAGNGNNLGNGRNTQFTIPPIKISLTYEKFRNQTDFSLNDPMLTVLNLSY